MIRTQLAQTRADPLAPAEEPKVDPDITEVTPDADAGASKRKKKNKDKEKSSKKRRISDPSTQEGQGEGGGEIDASGGEAPPKRRKTAGAQKAKTKKTKKTATVQQSSPVFNPEYRDDVEVDDDENRDFNVAPRPRA